MPLEHSKSILIIEDDKDILFALVLFLESENYEVRTAGNGLEGLKSLKAHGVPNVILLDMKMPIMNGWEFAEEFYKEYNNQVPIIVMTAAADSEKRAKEVGAAGWLDKPFDLDKLLLLLENIERKQKK